MKRLVACLPTFVLFLAVIALPACKQGVGEVCQVDRDCEDGLECNEGTNKCQDPAGDNPDAMIDYDAAPEPDASVDAGAEDAADEVDAPEADAASDVDAPQ